MRRNITESLKRFEAESAISTAKFELEYQKRRRELVEKYGKEAMERKDKQIEREWEKENSK